jgi:hypothetical protein
LFLLCTTVLATLFDCIIHYWYRDSWHHIVKHLEDGYQGRRKGQYAQDKGFVLFYMLFTQRMK